MKKKLKMILEKRADELLSIESMVNSGGGGKSTVKTLVKMIESLQSLRRQIFLMKEGRLDRHLRHNRSEDIMRIDALIQLVFVAKANELIKRLSSFSS